MITEQLVGRPEEYGTGGATAIVERIWLPDESNVWHYADVDE